MTDSRSKLPSVNVLLEAAEAGGLMDRIPRAVVTASIREVLSTARDSRSDEPADGWLHEVENHARDWRRTSLQKVINATGVILHTNLGRAPVSGPAKQAVLASLEYSTLELNIETGRRGSRQSHLKRLLRNITGAEDALVTVNAASALLLAINTVASDHETVISRGELVEIGGSFRLPDIISKSTSQLVEIGTTNRTHAKDYTGAITERTRCLLKVHRSNFVQKGFVADVEIADLTDLAPANVVVIHDVGSGLLLDLAEFGLTGEPMVQTSVQAGATTIFSGDKLLGGPQAGIIVGATDVLEKIAANPMARAVRPDKSTIAALEATLSAYLDRTTALKEIPVLAMLTADTEEISVRAQRLAESIPGATTLPGFSSVGGGSFPESPLPTTLVAISPESCEKMMTRLRAHSPPIIARVLDDRVVFDVRTMTESEIGVVATACS